jgi:hypothetical protein
MIFTISKSDLFHSQNFLTCICSKTSRDRNKSLYTVYLSRIYRLDSSLRSVRPSPVRIRGANLLLCFRCVKTRAAALIRSVSLNHVYNSQGQLQTRIRSQEILCYRCQQGPRDAGQKGRFLPSLPW